MSTPNQRLRLHYGFTFPESFFRFQEFVESLPPNMLREALGIRLEAPFFISKGEPWKPDLPDPHWQSRYYNDPPEFDTILSGDVDGLHWGYYLDDPATARVPVVHYWSNDAFQFGIDGDDVFEAVRHTIEIHHNDYQECLEDGTDDAVNFQESLDQLAALRRELQQYHAADRLEAGEDYLDTYGWGGSKWRKPVARTRDDLGICVPKRLYRPLTGEDKYQIWNYSPTHPEVEQQADEARRLLQAGYPGAALKLGKDLWIYRAHRPVCYGLLDAAYAALGRNLLRRKLQIAREYREFCESTSDQA